MRIRFWMRGALCGGALVLAAAGGCGSNQTPTKTQAAAPPAPAASAGTFQAVDAAPPPEKTGGFDGQRAFEHVRKLVEIGPRPPASEGIRKTQEYIEAQLKSFGCKWEEDNFGASTPIGNVQMKNILVKVPGKSRDIILLTTHYDTLTKPNFVGADDSGSSTGLMLEMARLLCGRKNALSIWIAFFDGEEAFRQWDKDTDSTFGSRQMAAQLAASGDLKRIKAMMLADLIGSRDLRVKRESYSTKWLTDLVWGTASRLGYGHVFVSDEAGIEDDHLAFLKRNVPSVDVIRCCELEIPYWHTTQDTLDKISPQSLAIVGHVFIESVAELEKKFQETENSGRYLRFKADIFTAGYDGVFLEIVVVAVGKIGAVVAPAAFFASQCRARDELGQGQDITQFGIVPGGLFESGQSERAKLFESVPQVLRISHNPDGFPHQFADLRERLVRTCLRRRRRGTGGFRAFGVIGAFSRIARRSALFLGCGEILDHRRAG